jgi:hypothetical protein
VGTHRVAVIGSVVSKQPEQILDHRWKTLKYGGEGGAKESRHGRQNGRHQQQHGRSRKGKEQEGEGAGRGRSRKGKELEGEGAGKGKGEQINSPAETRTHHSMYTPVTTNCRKWESK